MKELLTNTSFYQDSAMNESDLLDQLKIFHKETCSVKALNIIENFQSEVLNFIHIVPDEVKSKLLFSVESKDKIA